MNSVALHGDSCPICQSVEKELIKLSRDLNCSLQVGRSLWKSVAHFHTVSASNTLLLLLLECEHVKEPSRARKNGGRKKTPLPTLSRTWSRCFILPLYDCTVCKSAVELAAGCNAGRWRDVKSERLTLCEPEDKTADGFSVLSFPQNSQSGSGVTDGCEGAQVYPPTPPIMLQVNCK